MAHIETRRLILRRFTPADADDLHDYIRREEVRRFEPAWDPSPAACAAVARRFACEAEFTAAELKATGRLVGHVYLAGTPPPFIGGWELGYIFHPDHQGRGLASEACAALIERVFRHQRGHRIVARCAPENTRSWRLLERLGFRREGHAVKAVSFGRDSDGRPVWWDEYQYALLSEEWAGTTSRAIGQETAA
jgi:RimJ/RimL family protein N-acetyltransferase